MYCAIILSNSKTPRHYQMTKDCLASLRKNGGKDWKVVVVEQTPADHYGDTGCEVISPPALDSGEPAPFHYNLSLQAGWNALGRLGWQGDTIAVLNNDITFEPGFLPPIALALKNGWHSVSPWCPGYHDEYMAPGHLYYQGYRVTYELTGWALFFCREVVNRIGFDKLFPLDFVAYFQDNWYAYQLQRHDFSHVLVSTSRVKHLFGGSKDLIEEDQKEHWTLEEKHVFDRMVIEQRDEEVVLTIIMLGIPSRLKGEQRIPSDNGHPYHKLVAQAEGKPVEVVMLVDNQKSTVGRKRDLMVQMARGQYISMVDDDDQVSDDYVDLLLAAIEKHAPDVITFDCDLVVDNGRHGVAHFAGDEDRDDWDALIFYRRPNHLCCWKADLAKQVRFLDLSYGEDHDWGMAMNALAEKRHNINKALYTYHLSRSASEAQKPSKRLDRTMRQQEAIPVLNEPPKGKAIDKLLRPPTQQVLPAIVKPKLPPKRVEIGEHVDNVTKTYAAAQRILQPRLKIAVYTIAKNEAQHAQRWAQSCLEADLRFVLDTGSTDDTVAILQGDGVKTTQACVRPWRFDVARNTALALLPEDIDVCVSLDMDEVLDPGWRQGIEAHWKADTTRMWHWFKFSPTLGYTIHRIHARHGYRWKWPVHELLYAPQEVYVDAGRAVSMTNLPADKGASRYLDMLEKAVKEEPDDRMWWYYGRELWYAERYQDCIQAYNAFNELKVYPNCGDYDRMTVLLYQSRCHKALGDLDSAEKVLRNTCTAYPALREPKADLAQFYQDRQKWRQGLDLAQAALKITNRPNHFLVDPLAWSERCHDIAAFCALNLGLKNEAAKHAKVALTMNPPQDRLQSLHFMAGQSL